MGSPTETLGSSPKELEIRVQGADIIAMGKRAHSYLKTTTTHRDMIQILYIAVPLEFVIIFFVY
jgi:hypothetical protein